MRPVVFNWPTADTQAICENQDLAGAGNLVLDGSLSNIATGLPPTAVFPGISRSISITSPDDLSLVNFTITGTYNGNTLSEVLGGPNATTVESANIYDSIQSVSTSAAVTNASVGTGTTGCTHWFFSDYNRAVFDMSIQVIVTNNITYSFTTTSGSVDGFQGDNQNFTFSPIVAMTNATTDELADYSNPTSYSNIVITASNATGSLQAIFLQQGIV